MIKNYLLFFCLFGFSFQDCKVFAQSTNPAPFCYPTASNMTGGTCTGGYGYNIESIMFNTLSQSSACYGSGVNDVYRYWTATTSLYAGASYSVSVHTPKCSTNYAVSAGFWIDFNQNNKFDSAELLAASLFNNNAPYGVTHNFAFVVPCSAKAGKTRLRVRAQGTKKISSADSCKVPGGYGETWDFDVTIVQPTSVSASYTIPSKAFVKTVVKATINNKNDYTWYAWDINNDASFEQMGYSTSYNSNSSTWTTSGTKCIKVRATNCFGSDSFLNCITIVAPTLPPVVGFTKVTPCEKVLEVYNSIKLIDTSGQGPYIWSWKIYDSTTFKSDPFDPVSDENSGYVVFDNTTTKYSQFPSVSFYREGIYCVELSATNGVGTSKMTKRSYVKVISPITYFIGFGTYGANNDNRVASDFGRLFDDGGPNNNYGNKQGKATKSFLIINPSATRPITMKFEQLRLKDTKDSIKIYDDDKMDPSKLLAVLTSSNNGTYPAYTSTNNKMYFYFTSDSSGVDSGYLLQYTNTGVYQYSKNQSVSIGHNLLFVNQKSVFYNENESEFGFNFEKIWSVNDTVQTAYNNIDTFQYKFKYAGTQKVCLEMKDCDTSFKKCENILFESGLMGVVYKDNNSNCTYNSVDKLMPNIHMKLFDSTANSWSHYYTNSLGQYNFNKGFGTYKAVIDATGLPFRTICRTPGTDSMFRLSSSTPYRVINFDIGCKSGYDIGTQSVWTNGIVFPGRKHELRVSAGDMNKWFGLNCASGLSGSVVITVSGKVNYVNPVYGTLTPSSVSGKVFTYSIADFSNISINNDFGLIFKTDTSARAGDTISVHVRVTPSSSDNDTTNNNFSFRYRVSNSLDPNMKEVHPDELTDGFKDWLTYTIHFQNTGNAPAFDIRLQDTLDNLLDPETFQLLSYSHPLSTALVSNVLSFKFKDIMLPDSNSNEKGSHGFVQFRIRPKAPLMKGAKVNNKAFIYFDYNEPVVTNTTSNAVLPKCVIIPDPAFAAWLTAHYPSSMYKGYLLDTSSSAIKKETSVDVNRKNISNLYGIQFFVALESLNCSANQLAFLPVLPGTVTILNCSNNKLNSLSSLPAALIGMDCSSNNLSSLTSLPSSLQILYCGNNQLSSLPLMPSGLNELDCSNNKINCFEKFSQSIKTLNISGNKYKCLPNYISAMDAATKSVPLCIKGDTVNNPDNCNTSVPASVYIPDRNFAAWLSARYPACMHNVQWMDTSCSDIKNEQYLDVAGQNIADLFGIQFFVSLKGLNCSNNQLKGLPVLPVNLVTLVCRDNQLVILPALPNTLVDFNCDRNKLTTLPALPSSLKTLSCKDNKIIVLNTFPNALQSLYCDSNYLASLPPLPSGLNILSCGFNSISALPTLPAALDQLNVSFNKIATIPVLPSNLRVLICDNNKLNALPVLPAGLKNLYCNNNQIVCFDQFSENIIKMDISVNSNKCLPNYISAMDAATKSTVLCIKGDKVNNPDNCLSTQVSVEDLKSAGDLKVYPNPGKGLCYLSLPENLIGQEIKVEIYNVLGVLVYSSDLKGEVLSIDIRNQPDGVYILKVVGMGYTISKSLVKE